MFQSKGNILTGLFLIVIGIIFLLNTFGIADIDLFHLFFTFWPIVFIIIGIHFLWRRNSLREILYAILFISCGLILIGDKTNVLDLNISIWNLAGPMILIIVGINLFTENSKGNQETNYAILGGIEKKTEHWTLNNTSFVAFWGGVDLDLTLADIPQDKTDVYLTAVMGGIDIIIPDDINVECKGTAILGGIEMIKKSIGGIISSAQFSHESETVSEKTIRFHATAILGGIDIHQRKGKN